MKKNSTTLCTPQVVPLQSSMVCPKFTKQAPLLDLLYLAEDQSLYGVENILAKIFRPLVRKSPQHIQSNKDFVN